VTHKCLLLLEFELGDEVVNLRRDVDVLRAAQVAIPEVNDLTAEPDLLWSVRIRIVVGIQLTVQEQVKFVVLRLEVGKLVEVRLVRDDDGLGLLVAFLQFGDASEELGDVDFEELVGFVRLDLVVLVLLRALDLLERTVGVVPRSEVVGTAGLTGLFALFVGKVVMATILTASAQLGLLVPAVTRLGFNAEDGLQVAREV
jgi:hypothetical protein